MDDMHDGLEHPEALLAAYVDGSATPEERQQAEAHLATCAMCRDEVTLARGAYQALRALPDLEPRVAVAAGHGSADVVDIRSRRRSRVMAGAGVGAAAAGVGLLVGRVASGGPGSRPSAASSPGGARAPAITAPEAGGAPPSVTSADLAGLANALAGQGSAGRAATSTKHTESPAPAASGGVYRSAFAPGAQITCAAAAAGLPTDTVQIYAQPVILEGVSAWAVGYRIPSKNGGPAHIVLVVVAHSDCHVLYVARVVAPS